MVSSLHHVVDHYTDRHVRKPAVLFAQGRWPRGTLRDELGPVSDRDGYRRGRVAGAQCGGDRAMEPLIPLLALYLLLMQASIGLETVMTARSAYRSAAVAYAVTDVTRVLF